MCRITLAVSVLLLYIQYLIFKNTTYYVVGARSKTGTYLSSFNQEWSFTWDSVALPLYAILTY